MRTPLTVAVGVESPGSPPKVSRQLMLLGGFQCLALGLQTLAVTRAWGGAAGTAEVFALSALALTFASALWALTRSPLDRLLRNAAVVFLGVTTTLLWRLNDPLLFRGYDEQLHVRTLRDIVESGGLFQPHPILPVSSRYPGLEAVTALLHQFGVPEMAAATAVIVLARVVLVTVLCAAVEQATGSARAGGLAVAAYAASPQFVMFNSQFAYQTLALPLALAAVAFVARYRWARNGRPLLAGAAICLLAVAMTHHLTSLITAVFLIGWAVLERRAPARRRIARAGLIAVAASGLWASVQWSLLRDYFGPMMADVAQQLSRNVTREPFSESGGDPKPWWESMLLLYYALAITLIVSVITLSWARSVVLRRRTAPPSERAEWRPTAIPVLIAASIPPLFAARVVPRLGEVGDRASTFLFLPLSFLVAGMATRKLPWRRLFQPARHAKSRDSHRGIGIRMIAAVLATGVFLGGYIFGTGANWARLPGPYLPGAEGRSMDAETLGAARWARGALPPGSRIAGDRIGSTLLASEGLLWPVLTHAEGMDVPALYQADYWGPPQSDTVRRLHLGYLYVDRRFAGQKARVGGYFDEAVSLEFTPAQLAKFDDAEGIREVYRHGSVSIYELSGLGVSAERSGWIGPRSPTDQRGQIVLGLISGSLLAVAAASPLGRRFGRAARSFVRTAGPALAFAAAVAGLCVGTVTMLLAGLWPAPQAYASAVLVAGLIAAASGAFRRCAVTTRRYREVLVWAATLSVTAAVGLGVAADSSSAATRVHSAPVARCEGNSCDQLR